MNVCAIIIEATTYVAKPVVIVGTCSGGGSGCEGLDGIERRIKWLKPNEGDGVYWWLGDLLTVKWKLKWKN